MRKFPRWLFLTGIALAKVAHAQFLPTAAGPYNYNDPVNWTSGAINGVFSQTLTANQTILLPLELFAAPSFTFGGNFDLTLRADRFGSAAGSSPLLSAPSLGEFLNFDCVDRISRSAICR